MTFQTANSSTVKRKFGQFFQQANDGKVTIVDNKLTNKKVILADYEEFIDALEIMLELNNKELNKQIKEGYQEYVDGKCDEGIEGLIDIMNAQKKKELLSKRNV